jgi:hypothetical protein
MHTQCKLTLSLHRKNPYFIKSHLPYEVIKLLQQEPVGK